MALSSFSKLDYCDYLLDDIKEAFDLLEDKNFLIFAKNLKNDLSEEEIFFQMSFDQEKFKKVISKKLNFSNQKRKWLEKLKYKIAYHNIHQKRSNLEKFFVPIDIYLKVENSWPQIFLSRTIEVEAENFELKNLRYPLKISEQNRKKIIEKFNFFSNELKKIELAKLIKIKKEKILQYQEYDIEELGSFELSSIFSFSKNQKIKSIQKQINQNETNFFKINFLVNKAFFSKNNPFEINLKINYSLGFFELKKSSYAISHGKSVFIKINLDKNDFDKYFKQQYFKEMLDFKIVKNNLYNINFEKSSLKDFALRVFDENILITKVNYIKVDPKNALFEVDFKYKNEKHKIFKKIGLGFYSYIFEKDFQDSSYKAYNFIAENVQQEELDGVYAEMFRGFESKILSGGFNIMRSFYSKNTKAKWLHVGEDYLAPEYSAIVAPFDGKIIAMYESKMIDEGFGLGTLIMMKIDYDKLKLSPKEFQEYFQIKKGTKGYFYLGLIHLDRDTSFNIEDLKLEHKIFYEPRLENTIAYKIKPTKAKQVFKSQIIGYLGSTQSNGGWIPHVHVCLYSNVKKIFDENGFWQKTNFSHSQRFKNYWNKTSGFNISSVNVDGVRLASFESQKNQIYVSPINYYELNIGYVDPNALFKIRGKSSYWFDVALKWKKE
ncbi:MSC_0775 family lipoprotein [Mycoplasmopsis pulmonis]|uniref:MSC_0775 family lipoprotein n=1 Tax=Mycoplasmopsis pulmonis TaxID=2107 RepID=UPI002ACEA071|nr:hypothetical protein [Mycoplasmopsis pulmonis]MDZ7293550.1 hypothetical protein [Mycoplasmopsis pulmonis]